jgi:hypothetical protein
MNTTIDVALILWNPDVIDLVSLILQNRNLKSSGVEPSQGIDKIEQLIVSRAPRVVVFDLDPPYAQSAATALELMTHFTDCSFVMTCADRSLAERAAPWLRRHQVFQKPYDADEIAQTVRSMMKRPKTFAAAAV